MEGRGKDTKSILNKCLDCDLRTFPLYTLNYNFGLEKNMFAHLPSHSLSRWR